MTELGQSGNPWDLIPGSPDAILRNQGFLKELEDSLEYVNINLKSINTGSWQGLAANAFHESFADEPPKWAKAADAFHAAQKALDDYRETLIWGQSQARDAIALWDQGENDSRKAAANRSITASYPGYFPSAEDLADDGEELRQAARDKLNAARAQCLERAQRSAAILRDMTSVAPIKQEWHEPQPAFGDFLANDIAWSEISSATLPQRVKPSIEEIQRLYQREEDPNGDIRIPSLGFAITKSEAAAFDNLLNDPRYKDQAMATVAARATADKAAAELFPNQAPDDSHRNAFRHAYWNSLLCRTGGNKWAYHFATAHEGIQDNPPARMAMDLYNNEVGRDIARRHPEATPEQLAQIVAKAVHDGDTVVFNESNVLEYSNLVPEGKTGNGGSTDNKSGSG
ncbi:putative T7SS-secreted protein [Amycolatopsis sp. CA-126428]|uniref:putative T7SS-secreted protein n=1 Tax=Amycolatopsis sp. CA-126428 TaxID=2073158 RepID=UPI0011B00B4D|nr:hypothetical protein [Amycolatopsis sp. CA-126428]